MERLGAEKAIFLGALECAPDAERAAYLDAACGRDSALRRAVEELLAAHEGPVASLDGADRIRARFREQIERAAAAIGGAPAGGLPDRMPSSSDRARDRIGPYRLMEKIGEGGFGQVYVAEQQQPVRRRVALKLLKPGMDSREVIARFEAERQALAMMDHPHIARVFDAGTTEFGQPYFVMELVRGVPITQFCNETGLSTSQRLRLFVDVCQAVQHAHQKGVIHRDLKPSNVLVTLHDAVPVVKVIDFGVAKAISEPLTEKTLYTRFAQMIGTPLYMSPEQAEMNALDVDTRSDIYSLGVLLYELLTGTTPFDQRRLHTATFDEVRRIIREEDPPRPSARLAALAQAGATRGGRSGRGAGISRTAAESAADGTPQLASGATTLDDARGRPPAGAAELRSRASLLRGDLDWVVMKALEKDRRRRYETAADLARDVQRHLEDQPVHARPPSAGYRFRKFARRNRVALTTAALVLAALVGGTGVSIWQAYLAHSARLEAEALRQDAVEFADRLKEANVLLDSARANADQKRFGLALAQYTRATELQPDHYLAWSGRGSLYVRLGAWRHAATDFARALELGAPANNPGWWGVPQLCLYVDDRISYQRACGSMREQAHSDEPFSVAAAVRCLALSEDLDAGEAREYARKLDRVLAEMPPARLGAPGFAGGRSARPPDLLRFLESAGLWGDRRGGTRPAGERIPPGGGEFRFRPRVPPELLIYASSLAHYRAGEPEQALERLEPVLAMPAGTPLRQVVLPLGVLSHLAAGRRAEAEPLYAEAAAGLEDWTSKFAQGQFDQLPMPWFDYFESLILCREAHRRLRGAPLPADERLDRWEQQVLSETE